MSLLNELKKEAEAVKSKEARQKASAGEREDYVRKQIRPRMQALYSYLKEVVEHLNVVAPDIRHGYEVKLGGRLDDLRQGEYRVTTPDTRQLDQFTLHFTCRAAGNVEIRVRGKEATEHQREYLWGHNLRFTCKMSADNTGVFFLDAYVPVTVEFRIDLERPAIRLVTRNLELLGVNRVTLSPDQLTGEFQEELAKCVMRKENSFNALCGNTLTKEMRERLRQKLARDPQAAEDPETKPEKLRGGKRKGLFGFIR